MTPAMYKDIIKKQQKSLLYHRIAIAVLALLFIGMSIFAFSEFEIVYETVTDYEYEVDQDIISDDYGGDIELEQFAEQVDNTPVYVVCATVIIIALIAGGVYYGSHKPKNQGT